VKALLVGESWVIHMIHQKGFDSFTTTEYHLAAVEFKASLAGGGWDVTHIPAHEIEMSFPSSADELASFDAVIISDVGANSFLLTLEVFHRSEAGKNRLAMIRDYVLEGGGLIMVGGYLSFSGIEAKALYSQSPLSEILPVEVLPTDDRCERPEGLSPLVLDEHHPSLGGVGKEWPQLLGYNRTIPLAAGKVLVTVGGDPLVSVREVGKGRTAVFTSDMAPHWAPPPFLEWAGYAPLWRALATWVAGK
jgi:uncharacterized membrane protein